MGHHRDPWAETHGIQPSLTRRAWERGRPARIGPYGNGGITAIRGLKPTAKIRRHYATMEIPINSTVATRRGPMRHVFPARGGQPGGVVAARTQRWRFGDAHGNAGWEYLRAAKWETMPRQRQL